MRKRRVRAAALAALVVGAGLTSSVGAYTTAPLLPPIHEIMTRMAEQCRREAGGYVPTSCRDHHGRMLRLTGARRWLGLKYTPLEKSSRWSDDPRREMGLGWARQVLWGGCDHAAGSPVHQAGLLCSSHFGPLQYLHAMRSSQLEPRSQTHQRMMDWARFTFEVASGAVAVNDNLCTVLAGPEARLSIVKDFAGPGSRYCEEEWTVGRLFTVVCRRDDHCPPPPNVPETFIRTTATGALLHMLQDSYSQSHAARGHAFERVGEFQAVVSCDFPAGYYYYTPESSAAHRSADRRPRLAASCDRSDVADPITASAVILHHVDKRSAWKEVETYLTKHVFGPPPLP